MANITVTITGMEDAKATLKGLEKIFTPALASLTKSAERVMRISKSQFCPIDTGALRSTGNVQVFRYSATQADIEMGYGGPAAPYAIFVHEVNRNYRHGKQWKYLETPLKAATPEIVNTLVKDLERFIESKGAEGSITVEL